MVTDEKIMGPITHDRMYDSVFFYMEHSGEEVYLDDIDISNTRTEQVPIIEVQPNYGILALGGIGALIFAVWFFLPGNQWKRSTKRHNKKLIRSIKKKL